MSTDLTFKGIWCLPGHSEMLSGTLTFTPEKGAELELYGEFTKGALDIIWGSGNDGVVTLVDCFVSRYAIGQYAWTKVTANYVFLGEQFQKKEDIKFNSIAYHCSNLDEWLWNNNISTKPHGSGLLLQYIKPQEHTIALDKKHSLRIFTETILPPMNQIPYYSAALTERSYLEFCLLNDHTEPLDYLLRYKEQMDAFLTLAIGLPQQTDELYGISQGKKITIFIQPFFTVSTKQVLPPNMFINRRWYQNHIDAMIKRWFERYALLEDVFNLYFSLLRQKKIYTQHRFLFRVQILEAYHRKVLQSTETSKRNQAYIKDLLGRIENEQDRQFLQDKLAFAYEPSLHERLVELFGNCSIADKILNTHWDKDNDEQRRNDINKFVVSVKQTRNYLTHYDKSLIKKAKKGKELYDLSEQLDLFIRYYLFIELGFTPDECRQRFDDIYHFNYR